MPIKLCHTRTSWSTDIHGNIFMGLKRVEGKESPSEGILPENHMEYLFSACFQGGKSFLIFFLITEHQILILEEM